MFDNTQKIEQNYIDERILPDKGIICLWRLLKYVGKGYSKLYLEETIQSFNERKIPIFKISNDMSEWLVRLEDIKGEEPK